MVDFLRVALIAGLGWLLVSCGSETADPVAAAPAQDGFQSRSGDGFDNDSDKMLTRYGKTNPLMEKGQGGEASEGATRGNEYFQGEIAKREFAAKDYTKKAFWGSKEYARKVYGGETDGSRFQQASRFDSQGAREGALTSRDSGSRYETSRKTTGSAREDGVSGISKVSDAETDSRRRSYRQPEVTDWRNQRGLTVDDTRDMLGR